MSVPLHPIEQIESLIKSSVSHARDAIELKMWPANAPITPQQIGLRQKGSLLVWPKNLDRLDAGLIKDKLELQQLEILHIVDSTNTRMLNRTSPHSLHNTLTLAEFQYGGRGRRGRAWLSPYARNLSMSLGLRSDKKLAQMGGLSLVVGLAMAAVLEELGVQGLALKWPNDVLVDDKKISGILVELVQKATGVEVVIGMGVNVDLSDEEIGNIEQPITDLRRAGVSLSRTELVVATIANVQKFVQQFEGEGFEVFIEAYNAVHKYHQKPCTMVQGDQNVQGTVLGVGVNGELILNTPGGVQQFHGGEVSLRPVGATHANFPSPLNSPRSSNE